MAPSNQRPSEVAVKEEFESGEVMIPDKNNNNNNTSVMSLRVKEEPASDSASNVVVQDTQAPNQLTEDQSASTDKSGENENVESCKSELASNEEIEGNFAPSQLGDDRPALDGHSDEENAVEPEDLDLSSNPESDAECEDRQASSQLEQNGPESLGHSEGVENTAPEEAEEVVEQQRPKKRKARCGADARFCRDCGISFVQTWSKRRHLLEVHTEQRNFKCRCCDKTFKRAEFLRGHLSSVHQGIRYNCTLCDKKYCKKQSLILHTKKCEKKHFKCAKCGKQGKDCAFLKRHHCKPSNSSTSKRKQK